jgi:predicted metal-dependent phosphotriesterase family hydrolase
MAHAHTVKGPIDTSLLVVTLMHEHIFVLSPEINQNYPESWGDEEVRVEGAVRKLRELKSGGVDTLVDMTVIGLGRHIPRIQRIPAQVNLSRVIIGHCGDTTDVEYLEQLMEKGSFIGMDRFGIDALLPFERRVDTVAGLCRKGYAGKIVLSQDAACYNDNYPEESLAKAAPNWNYLHVVNQAVPALKGRGVTDGQISAMLVHNPRRIFESNAIVT